MKVKPRSGADYWSILVDLINVSALWYFFGHSSAVDADTYGHIAVAYVVADVITQIYVGCVVYSIASGESRLVVAICAVFFLFPFYPMYKILPPAHLKEFGLALVWIVLVRIGLAAARAPQTATYTALTRMLVPTVIPVCLSLPLAAAAGLYVAIGATVRHTTIGTVDALNPLAVFATVYYLMHAALVLLVSRQWIQRIAERKWGSDAVVDPTSARDSKHAANWRELNKHHRMP